MRSWLLPVWMCVAAAGTPASAQQRVVGGGAARAAAGGGPAPDHDCGAAALVTLFRIAGVETNEAHLLAGLPAEAFGRGGLSAKDLRTMVAASGSGLTLSAEWINQEELPRELQTRAFILLLRDAVGEPRGGQVPAMGHFVVVEAWSAARGYLVADPAVGRRGFVTADELGSTAHRGTSGRVLALGLVREGVHVGVAPAVSALEERAFGSLADLRRDAIALPEGKVLVTLHAAAARSRTSLGGDDPFALGTEALAGGLTVRRGLPDGGVLTGSVGFGRSRATLHLPGAPTFRLGGSDEIGPYGLSYGRRLDLRVAGGEVFAHGGLEMGDGVGVQGGTSATWRLGAGAFTASLDGSLHRRAGSLQGEIAGSAGYSHQLSSGFGIGAGFTARAGRRMSVDATFFADLAVSRSVSLGLFASSSIAGGGGGSSQAGLSLTFALPRPLNRAASAAVRR